MRKCLTWTIIIVLVTSLLPHISFAQSVKRQSIGSYGSNGFTESAIIGQTIGQPFSTYTYSGSKLSLVPGFQQPVTYKKGKASIDMQAESLDAFPNPATVSFTLESQEFLENVELKVSDINGRLLLEKQLSELTAYQINCSAWQAGMYFITVESQKKQYRYSTKLIIIK